MEFSSAANDVLLLGRVAQHDETALSQLYDRYARIIYSIAFKSLKSVEESEEIVLDVFAQVWRIADRYNPKKSRVDTWLFMLTRSRVLDRLRKNQHLYALSPICTDIWEKQISSSSIDPIEEVVISERRDRVLLALKLLPSEQRLVIELAYYQGFTQSEISAKTGVSLGTVKTRIRLGLTKLKSALDVEV